MSILLTPAGGLPQLLRPTTTTKLAERILLASRIFSEVLPEGLNTLPVLDILLDIYVAEESARYPRTSEIDPPGTLAPSVTQRWIAALVSAGLVERRGDLVALSTDGHVRVTTFLQTLYAAQRAVD